MKHKRGLTMTFAPDFANVDLVRAAVQAICRENFATPGAAAATMDFCLAVTEALNNAVEHSGAPLIVTELSLSRSEALFRIATEGVPFDPTVAAAMPDPDDPAGMPDGGYGLSLMHELADTVTYHHEGGRNILTLGKIYSGKKEGGTADGDQDRDGQ